MPRCIVDGCSHGSKGKLMPANIILHAFPKDLEQIKKWLMATGQNFGDLEIFSNTVLAGKKTDSYRLCSVHFTEDCYKPERKKRALKKDAVPSIFNKQSSIAVLEEIGKKMDPVKEACQLDLASTSSLAVPSFKVLKNSDGSMTGIKGKTQKQNVCRDIGTSTDYFILKKNKGTSTNPKLGMKNASTCTAVKMKDQSTMCDLSDFNLSLSAESMTFLQQKGFSSSTPIKSVPGGPLAITPWLETGSSSLSDIGKEMEDIQHPSNVDSSSERDLQDADESYMPPEDTFEDSIFGNDDYDEDEDTELTIEDDMNHVETETINTNDKTFLVFESCLDKLLFSAKCTQQPSCSSPIRRIKKYVQGSFLSVKAVCASGHHLHLWESQPHKGRLHYGNIMMAAAILLSGSNFCKVYSMNKLLHLHQISQATFYRYQYMYLFPVVNHHWVSEKKELIKEFEGKAVALSGDGQCDSPGYSAKYCVYTLMEQTTKKVLNFDIQQVSPSVCSNNLEREALKICLNELIGEKINVKIVCTDRHKSVRKIFRDEYPLIRHQFDVWHFGKSIRSKLTAASKKKNCEEIKEWISATVNHLWWCSRTCDGNVEILKEKWTSLTKHVTNVHQWESGKYYHQCDHEELSELTNRKRKWMTEGSTAYITFTDIILSFTLLKDLDQLSHFCHTGELEVYHSKQLKYRSKRYHYFMDGMFARTQIGALDHNYNVQREQAKVSVSGMGRDPCGSMRHKQEFTKARKDWVVKPIFEPTSNAFLFSMMRDVMLCASGELNVTWISPCAQLPANIALQERPPKKEAVEKHLSRFR
ncbi:hypothetical protein XELAEV_18045817mg [Xenopus laevis]|uniref:THAP-type domain-containing protein n=1 Tax=Xenopus laevis TaxID=8355 RepID=A0A974C197_XENLA|nr:hypothetical protein XELAEV_18045817mg [Xenopus laevis]